MRTFTGFLVVLGLVLILSGSVWGHLPASFTYLAVQFPDTYLPILDGDLSEWDIIPDTYVIYTEDYYEQLAGLGKGGAGVDLADLAIRSVCGWNDSTNRLYFMGEVFDDIHQTDRADPQCNWTDDCWEIVIDANHSGGRHGWFSDLTEEENKRLQGAEGTHYIVAEPPVQDVDFTSGNASTWTSEPGDYYDIGWDFTGDEFGESTYYYELFIYPFSDLNWEGPDVSRHHDLTEGEIVGIGLAFGDFDELSDSYDSYWTISGGDATCGLSEALGDMYMSALDPTVFLPEGMVLAGFTGSPRSGDTPLTVMFTDASLGDVTTYAWDFGDGRTSTQQHPMHTYTMPGSYTIALTVTGPEGSDTETKSDYISVTGDPTLRAWMPSVPAVPGETIQVPIHIDDLTGHGVVSADILVAYLQTDVVTATGVETAGTLLDGIPGGNIQYHVTSGQIDIAVTSAPDTLEGEGILLYVVFDVSGDVEPIRLCDLYLEELVLNDGMPVVGAEDGNVGVTELGDVSYNFRVTAYDAALTVLGSVGEIVIPDPVYPNLRLVVADVDGDGDMDAVDGVLMLQYAVGLLSDFPGSLAKVVTTVGLGEVERMADGTLVVPVLVEDMSDVLAGEVKLSVSGGVPVRVIQGDGVGGYVFGSRVEGRVVRIAFAGVRSGEGEGRVAELHFDPERGEPGEVALEWVRLNGDDMAIGQRVVEVSDRPGMYVLSQNYPNPFNPGTAIEFEIPESGDVALGIYNTGGQRVRELMVGYRDAGRYKVSWDGCDDVGHEVSAGVYLYELRVNRFSSIKKMTLVR